MKRYKLTLLLPHTTEIVAQDAQAAHNEASRMVEMTRQDPDNIQPVIHSVTYLSEVQDDFDYPPPAA